MKLKEETKRALLLLVAALIEAYGLPGLLLIYGIYYLEEHVSSKQHEQLVNMYLLGQGAHWFPAAVVTIIAVVVVFAQRRWYDKRLKEKDRELIRVGDEKSKLQEQRIDAPLHHGDEDQRRSVAGPVPRKPLPAEERKKLKEDKTTKPK